MQAWYGVCGVQEQPPTLIHSTVRVSFHSARWSKERTSKLLAFEPERKHPSGEASTESCNFSHFGLSFVHAKHTGKCCFPQPATKLSGLFGEIQQKLFLWEFHQLELHHTGQGSLLRDVNTFPVQCIMPFRRASVQAGFAFITLLSFLRRRLQHSFGVKWVCSASLLLNISFSLYWLTLLPSWAASLWVTTKRPPELPGSSSSSCAAPAQLWFIFFLWILLFSFPPHETYKNPLAAPAAGKHGGVPWGSLLSGQSLNQNNNCLSSSFLSSQKLYFLCFQTFFTLLIRSILFSEWSPSKQEAMWLGSCFFKWLSE